MEIRDSSPWRRRVGGRILRVISSPRRGAACEVLGCGRGRCAWPRRRSPSWPSGAAWSPVHRQPTPARRARPPVGPRVHARRQHGVHRAVGPHQHPVRRPAPGAGRARPTSGPGRGRDARRRRRPALHDQPTDLHLLPVERLGTARRPGRPLADQRRGDRARPTATDIVTGIPVNTRQPAATPAAGPGSAPTATCGSAPATRPPAPCPRTRTRSAARCCASTPTAPGRPATRAAPFRPADLQLRPPQRAGHRVQPGRQGVLDRARHRPRRRGQPAVPRRQLRLGPATARRRIRLRRVAADDRPREVSRTPSAAVWCSGFPTIAPSGGTFLHGSQWAGWDNTLAVAVLKGQQLRVFAFDRRGPASRAAVDQGHQPRPSAGGGAGPERRPLHRHRRQSRRDLPGPPAG